MVGDNDPLDTMRLDTQALLGNQAADPDEHLERRELAQAVTRCLQALPERARAAFWAQTVEGQSGQAIAERLQTTRNAVFILLADARKRLRECLKRSGYQPGGRA